MVSFVNLISAISTIAIHVIIVSLIFEFLVFRKNNVQGFLGRYAIPLSFVVVLSGMLISLFYSEVVGYEPCKLCWIQRIFMYPQVIILGIAMWRKDNSVILYSLVLSILGAIVAGYQTLLQFGFVPPLPCSAVGSAVSCSQRFVFEFGYVTIPMMAFTAFAFVGILMAIKLRSVSRQS